MQVVTEPSEPGEFRRWVEHFREPALRVGTFRIVAGGTDDQHPHAEDEIYVVRAGRARLVAGDESVAVGPGSVVFVPAGEVHRFVDVSEELEVLVVFAPAESGG
jgi:mannose-6-phosphate isomerase-like protein (cupin superfamily)